VNLLATLLPGVRQLRTPLAVGVLWIVALVLPLSPQSIPLGAAPESLRALGALLNPLPQSYLLVAAVFGAYILGNIMLGMSEGFLRVVSAPILNGVVEILTRLQRMAYHRRLKKGTQVRPGLYRSFWPRLSDDLQDPSSVRGPLMDLVSSAYAKVGGPSIASMSFPIDGLIERLDVTALQVWSKEPAQYQEYDRLGAEADFRAGVGLPLMAISVSLAIRFNWAILLVTLIAVLTLARQSLSLRRKRDALIANALYLGVAESPQILGLLEGLGEQVAAGDLSPDDSWPKWAAATVVALDRRADGDLSSQALNDLLATFGPEGLDEAEAYFDLHDVDSAEYIRRVRERKAREADQRPGRRAEAGA
jgi:hypothetical protein